MTLTNDEAEMELANAILIFVPGLDEEILAEQLAIGVKPFAEETELQGVIDQLYKPTDTIPGGTAGAVREELRTGKMVNGRPHLQKALERANQLTRMIRRGRFSGTDLALARALVKDLLSARAGK